MNFIDLTYLCCCAAAPRRMWRRLQAGAERSTLNVGDGSIVNSIQGHWDTLNLTGNATVGSIQGDSGK